MHTYVAMVGDLFIQVRPAEKWTYRLVDEYPDATKFRNLFCAKVFARKIDPDAVAVVDYGTEDQLVFAP